MIYNASGDKIEYTWDFGRVRNTYVPVKSYVDKATIYERWWANYIADLYDADTRVVEAYVKMEGKVVGDWLRAIYWWDNCYWVLTEINDYNITSYATTRCKFVKVNDIANYTSAIVPPGPSVPTATLVPEKYIIVQSGETINARVVTSDGGAWHLEYPSYVHPSQVAGTGDTNITLRFDSNPNDDGRDFNIAAYRTVGTNTHFWQEGRESVGKELTLSNKTFVLAGGVSYFGTIINYKNRGEDSVTITGIPEWITITEPLAWDGDVGSIGFATTGINSSSTVSSATLTFRGVNETGLTDTMIIDWLPRELVFEGNGGTKQITLLNNGLEVEPKNGYWATFTTGEHTIDFTAPPNLDVQTRTERVVIHYMNSGATNWTIPGGFIILVQEGGGSDLKVEPDVLYYNVEGGDKYITVTCSNAWTVQSKPEWIRLSSMDGSPGSTMVLATAEESQEPYSRTGEIIFTDGRGTAVVTIQQLGNSDVRALSASPQTVMAVAPESSYTVDVFYANRNGDFVTMTPSSAVDWYLTSTIEWTGDTGRFTVYVKTNEDTEGRSIDLLLSAVTGEVSTTVTIQQAGDTPYINLIPSAITFDATGGTESLTAQSNVPWDIDINDTQ